MTLAEVRRYALSLPEATEAPHFERTSFRVRNKIFVTAHPSEGHIHVFLPEEYREPALAMHPAHFQKLLWGGKVVGLRVKLERAPVGATRELIRFAWQSKAPRSLFREKQAGRS
jgi:hypothetical protein